MHIIPKKNIKKIDNTHQDLLQYYLFGFDIFLFYYKKISLLFIFE